MYIKYIKIVYQIKKSMAQLQLQKKFLQIPKRKESFALVPTVIFVSFLTYFICFMGLDPDHLAQLQVEYHENGLKGVVYNALNFDLKASKENNDNDNDDNDNNND